jgi:hypothetical protein
MSGKPSASKTDRQLRRLKCRLQELITKVTWNQRTPGTNNE